jgi:putative transposase
MTSPFAHGARIQLKKPPTLLLLENLALRHQLVVSNRNAGKPKFRNPDRMPWVCLRAVWSRWERALVIIQPQMVIGWHRAGFRLYWRWQSRGD